MRPLWITAIAFCMAAPMACGAAPAASDGASGLTATQTYAAAVRPDGARSTPTHAPPTHTPTMASILIRDLQAATPSVELNVDAELESQSAMTSDKAASVHTPTAPVGVIPSPTSALAPHAPTAAPAARTAPTLAATPFRTPMPALIPTSTQAPPISMRTAMPAPTAALAPTPSSTSTTALTPIATEMPAPTKTPYPTQTAVPTPTSAPTPFSILTPAASPTPTLIPTATVTSTQTAAPTLTVTVTPTHTPTYAPTHTAVPGHCRIKGNINSSGEKIYHTTASSSYSRTEIDAKAGERRFCTEQEAQAAGWRAPRQRQALPTATVVPSDAPAGCKTIVNINTAGVKELDTLPGIGPVKAQAIVDYRNAHGEYANVEELDKVDGIGEKTLEKIEPCVIFE